MEIYFGIWFRAYNLAFVDGTFINIAAIIIGGCAGLMIRKQPSTAFQNQLKVLLGVAALIIGLRIVWMGLNGSLTHCGKQLAVTLFALILGRLIGRGLRLQKLSSRLGQIARDEIATTAKNQPHWSTGFQTGTLLFCATPMALLGSIADGLADQWQPLLIKGIMEGMAAFGFVSLLGGSLILAALPVFALQGTIALACAEYLKPFLEQQRLLDSALVIDGWLITFVAVMILEIRKVELADYLPALTIAPLLAWLWR